jgi:hypothetical protein
MVDKFLPIPDAESMLSYRMIFKLACVYASNQILSAQSGSGLMPLTLQDYPHYPCSASLR